MQVQEQQYLTFMLEREVYAVGILKIKEIIEYSGLTEVPLLPGFIRGVINLRGRGVPVLDLLTQFGKGHTTAGHRTCIVILEAGSETARQDIGVLVDAVNEVVDIPETEIEPAPRFGTGLSASVIHGMGKVAGRFVIILNVDSLLSAETFSAMAGIDVHSAGHRAEAAPVASLVG